MWTLKRLLEKEYGFARVPDYSIEDVSDQALALLLACARKIAFKDRQFRAVDGICNKPSPPTALREKPLGWWDSAPLPAA